MAGYQHLHVEDTPPPPVSQSPRAVTVQLTRVRPTPQSNADAYYYMREMERAIREREDVKQSLESEGGAGAYWRRMAKDAGLKLAQLAARTDGIRQREYASQQTVMALSEQLETYQGVVRQSKQRLWAMWSVMSESDPMKQPLWDVWRVL